MQPLPQPPAPLLTVAQVATALGVSAWTVRRLVHEGQLPAVQLVRGGHLRFRPTDVEALMQPNVGAAA